MNVPPTQLPRGWMWAYYLDGIAHALRLTSMAQFDCAAAPCPTFPVIDDGAVFVTNPYDFMSSRLETTFATRWESAGWLILITAGIQLAGVLVTRFVNHQKR
jgi:hypothetical protein